MKIDAYSDTAREIQNKMAAGPVQKRPDKNEIKVSAFHGLTVTIQCL